MTTRSAQRTDQLRVLGFNFLVSTAAVQFAERCTQHGLKVWRQDDTVAVVVPSADVEAIVRITADGYGGTAAG